MHTKPELLKFNKRKGNSNIVVAIPALFTFIYDVRGESECFTSELAIADPHTHINNHAKHTFWDKHQWVMGATGDTDLDTSEQVIADFPIIYQLVLTYRKVHSILVGMRNEFTKLVQISLIGSALSW